MVQKIKQHPFITVGIVVVIVAIIAFILAIYYFGSDWTGFTGGKSNIITITSSSKGTITATEMQPGKTLWDLLNIIGILAIPVVVGLGGLWYTARQEKVSERETRDNQHHATLQAYLDKMSELLLNGNLAERTADGRLNPEYKQGCLVAKVRTMTVLTQLDARRIGYIFAFLREAELMSVTKDDNAISLKNADLHAVDWSQADLRGADLRGVNLSGANLSGAIFCSTIYVVRAFGGTISVPNSADLSGADLSGADLSGAKITDKQLAKAASLKGAILPDGTIHS